MMYPTGSDHMKKWICCLVCLLLCMAAAAAPAEVPTEKEVIRITDAEGLLKMAEAPEASYILENDIDMTGIADPAKEAEYGFATGKVYTATLKNGTVNAADVTALAKLLAG